MFKTVRQDCPNDTVTLRDRKVVKVEKWKIWNNEPWPTIVIERRDNDYLAYIAEPGNRGQEKIGSLSDVLKGLDARFVLQVRRLFEVIIYPSDSDVRMAGFHKWKITRT